jgi:type IV secretory pathway VirD2 relaxase
MSDTAFIHKHRLCEKAFTRSRKLDLKRLVTFLLNHRKGATQTELYRFFAEHIDDDMPFRHITKSPVFKLERSYLIKPF